MNIEKQNKDTSFETGKLMHKSSAYGFIDNRIKSVYQAKLIDNIKKNALKDLLTQQKATNEKEYSAEKTAQCKINYNGSIYVDGSGSSEIIRILKEEHEQPTVLPEEEPATPLPTSRYVQFNHRLLSMNISTGQQRITVEQFIEKMCNTKTKEYNLGNSINDAWDEINKVLDRLIALNTLTILSTETKEKIKGAEELQAMDTGYGRLITANTDNFKPTEMTKTGYHKRETDHEIAMEGFAIAPQVEGSECLVDPRDFPQHAHAEIILLAKVINDVFSGKKLDTIKIKLSGIKAPCGYCLKIINKFIEANNSEVEFDYRTIHDSAFFSNTPARGASNVSNYTNALNVFDASLRPKIPKSSGKAVVDFPNIDSNTISRINNDDKEKAWLKRMLSVIALVKENLD